MFQILSLRWSHIKIHLVQSDRRRWCDNDENQRHVKLKMIVNIKIHNMNLYFISRATLRAFFSFVDSIRNFAFRPIKVQSTDCLQSAFWCAFFEFLWGQNPTHIIPGRKMTTECNKMHLWSLLKWFVCSRIRLLDTLALRSIGLRGQWSCHDLMGL